MKLSIQFLRLALAIAILAYFLVGIVFWRDLGLASHVVMFLLLVVGAVNALEFVRHHKAGRTR